MRKTRPRGRPPGSGAKAQGEKFVAYTFRMTPTLLDRFRATVAAQARAAFLRDALEEKLAREDPTALSPPPQEPRQ